MLVWICVQIRAAVIREIYVPNGFTVCVKFSRLRVKAFPPPFRAKLHVRALSLDIGARYLMFSIPREWPIRECSTGTRLLSGSTCPHVARCTFDWLRSTACTGACRVGLTVLVGTVVEHHVAPRGRWQGGSRPHRGQHRVIHSFREALAERQVLDGPGRVAAADLPADVAQSAARASHPLGHARLTHWWHRVHHPPVGGGTGRGSATCAGFVPSPVPAARPVHPGPDRVRVPPPPPPMSGGRIRPVRVIGNPV